MVSLTRWWTVFGGVTAAMVVFKRESHSFRTLWRLQ
ncbi:hypothetical protein COLO4_23266 [Corchorus olitorius]|uniref:Uncharacterized protein n=1 Tax=Corchorus olitorius TaxID=93759 RepID=A0A1R3GXI7_9ROSI|nr:hypothetical protein COLO4_32896 [Corchorus olitorius]OMO82067.1 hypothetical protein COLO4_23266 [Corchorus olitorius]